MAVRADATFVVAGRPSPAAAENTHGLPESRVRSIPVDLEARVGRDPALDRAAHVEREEAT